MFIKQSSSFFPSAYALSCHNLTIGCFYCSLQDFLPHYLNHQKIMKIQHLERSQKEPGGQKVSSLKTQIDAQTTSLHGNFRSLLYYQGQLRPQLLSSLSERTIWIAQVSVKLETCPLRTSRRVEMEQEQTFALLWLLERCCDGKVLGQYITVV